MKVRVYVIDFELPPRLKKWAIRLGLPLAVVLGGGAIAWAAGGLTVWNSGDTLQASDLNANFAYLQGQVTPQGFPPRTPSAFLARQTIRQVISGNLIQKLNFDDLQFDVNGEFDTTASTFTPKADGIYLITCAVNWATGATGEVQSAILQKNGQDLDGTDLVAGAPGATFLRPEVTTIAQLNAEDVIQCMAFQNLTVSVTTSTNWENRTRFAAARLY